jgi:hypothetical protein
VPGWGRSYSDHYCHQLADPADGFGLDMTSAPSSVPVTTSTGCFAVAHERVLSSTPPPG